MRTHMALPVFLQNCPGERQPLANELSVGTWDSGAMVLVGTSFWTRPAGTRWSVRVSSMPTCSCVIGMLILWRDR